MEKKPQGRPKGSTGTNNRTVRKTVTLTPYEWQGVEKLAEVEGVTPRVYFQRWFKLALKGLGDKEKKLVDLTFAELLKESTRITFEDKAELQALCDGVVLGDKREEEG